MKSKMTKSKMANKASGLKGFLDSMSKPKMKKGGSFPDLNKDGKITRADILKGRGVFKDGGMSMGATEGFENAKRTITDGYKGTGAPNPLRNILKKNKMQMGGSPESFSSRKSRTVSVSPDKKYKTIVKEKMGPEGVSTTVTNRRTVKGVMTKAPKPAVMKNGGQMKPKYGMGGSSNAYGMNLQPLLASSYQNDTLMNQSLKKGGMVKKKKK